MKIVFKTNEGKTVDTTQVQYMTMGGKEYAVFLITEETPVIQNKFDTQEGTFIETLFGTEFKPKRKISQRPQSVAHKVREWLNGNLNPGDTTNIASTTEYAIRVAAEGMNKNISIRKIRKGMFNVIYNRPQKYARSKYRV